MHPQRLDLARRDSIEPLTVNAQAACVCTVNAGQHFDQRRLACAVLTDQTVNRPRVVRAD